MREAIQFVVDHPRKGFVQVESINVLLLNRIYQSEWGLKDVVRDAAKVVLPRVLQRDPSMKYQARFILGQVQDDRPSGLLEIKTEMHHQKWDRITVRLLEWLDLICADPKQRDQPARTIEQLIEVSRILSKQPIKFAPGGRLHRSSEHAMYLMTHIILFDTLWGARSLDADFQTEGREWVRCLGRWAQQMIQSDNHVAQNFEVLIETLCCMLLLNLNGFHLKTKRRTLIDHGIDLIVQLRQTWTTQNYKAFGHIPYMFAGRSERSRYNEHVDYHSHFLVALFLTLYKKVCSPPIVIDLT